MNPFKNLNPFEEKKTSEINSDPTAPANDAEKLVKLKEDFNKKRLEYRSSRNIWYTVAVSLTSIGIFISGFYFILGQSSSHDVVTTIRSNLLSKEFINTELASAISISASFALIIPIIYTIARVMRTQQRNAEISSLNQEIRNVRSRIIQQKQEKFIATDEDIIRSFDADVENMIDSLTLIDKNPNHIAYSGTQNRIDAIKSRYSDYEKRRYKYAKVLGVAFGTVDHAILMFMNTNPKPSSGPTSYDYDQEHVKDTISLLNKASLALKKLNEQLNPTKPFNA